MRSENQTRPVTLITGASGGIGADLARVFARNGHDLALIARSGDRLSSLAGEIEAGGRQRPLTLALDLAEASSVDAVEDALRREGATAEILVNNAGYGLNGPAADLDEAGQLGIIDLNVRALTQLTLRFLPQIRAARGKILNVASVVSFFPGGPGMAVYYASKAFVLSFSLGLAQELRKEGVTVSALCPGVTPTGFQTRAGFAAGMKLEKLPATRSIDVAEAGYRGLMEGRREIIPGAFNKLGVRMLPFAPRTAVLSLVSQLQQKRQ